MTTPEERAVMLAHKIFTVGVLLGKHDWHPASAVTLNAEYEEYVGQLRALVAELRAPREGEDDIHAAYDRWRMTPVSRTRKAHGSYSRPAMTPP